jgi:hypothetical protein
MAAGIYERHSRECVRKGGRCCCEPSYKVRIREGGENMTRTFTSLAEAKGWRKVARIALRRGRAIDQGGRTLRAGRMAGRGLGRRRPRTRRHHLQAIGHPLL